MGAPKLLLPWRGKTLVEHVIAAWRASRVRATFAVVRPDDDKLARVAEAAGAIVVRPPLPPPDMRTSVCFGLGEIGRLFSPTSTDAWLVAPADMPRLSTAVIDRLITEHERNPATALVPVVAGQRGHPLLVPWSWRDRVKQLGADQGLNVLLKAGATLQVECGDLVAAASFGDVDTWAEYEAL